jgi:hypothetical protein
MDRETKYMELAEQRKRTHDGWTWPETAKSVPGAEIMAASCTRESMHVLGTCFSFSFFFSLFVNV